MKNLLEISQLSPHQIQSLLQQAYAFKQGKRADLSQHYAANLFYENSTRTRASFEIAARKLQLPILNLNSENSSEKKGETVEDSLLNLHAMGVNLMIIRHQEEGIQQRLAQRIPGVAIINAGDGVHAHPSQALLDLMTIYEIKPELESLKVAIIGNISHSRVANSFQCIAKSMGIGQLMLIAPPVWHPKTVHYGEVTDSLQQGIEQADVLICLRVQQERLQAEDQLDLSTYRNQYALTRETLKLAKKDAIIMHPGPVNRGVEIDSELVESSQSRILQQVQNGVFMRMAIMHHLLA